MAEPSRVHVLGIIKEEWVPVAQRYGKWVPMHPKHFPVSGSRNEVLDRVYIRAGQDHAFRRKWRGWQFMAVRFDDSVILAEDGRILRGE